MIIYGIHSVITQLTDRPETVQKVYLKEGLTEVLNVVTGHNIPYTIVPLQKLASMTSGNHQGVIAEITDIRFTDFSTWLRTLPETPCAVVIFDEIHDPHNVGAIIRSGTALGVQAFIFPKYRQSPITDAVIKTGAGTVGVKPLIRVSNTNHVIAELKKHGFWIYGLSADGVPLTQETFPQRCCFIIGGEHKGLRYSTRTHTDVILRIPMDSSVESLNASVAAALVFYEWKRGIL